DMLEMPIKSIAILGGDLYVLSQSFLYRLTREGEKVAEKAIADGFKLLTDYEGPVVITKKNVIYFTRDMEVLSSGSYEGAS
ncbi:MAG: hypothetical protein Q9N34_02510, partial [Aquificota bacterium]|nr:hypothetical protein [Aquificota bacterium]